MRKSNLRERGVRRRGRPAAGRTPCVNRQHELISDALKAARFGVWEWDLASGSVACAGSVGEVFGFSVDCPTARDIMRRIHPDDRDRAMRPVPDGPFAIEYRIVLPDGRLRWVATRGIIYAGQSGRPARRLAAVFDITALKLSQQRLEALADQRMAKLEDAVRQLEAFSFSVSHDIRAPLRSMINYAELAHRACYGKIDQKSLSYLEKVSSAASRLEKLTHDLLRFSRLSKGPSSLASVPLATVVAELVEEYPDLEAAKASFRFADVRGNALANESMLRQALSNILENAVRFRDPARPLSVRVWTHEQNGRIRLFVQDNGIGIEPRHHERIFLPFERLHPGEIGTGMGLAIAKRAVELMGGRVGFESAPGRGSTFWLELPKA